MNSNTQTGTPRGFQLTNMPFGFPGNLAAGLPNPTAFQNMFGQNQASIPGAWGAPGADFIDERGGGPMRRQPRFNQNRTGGPYDRQPRDSRNNRWTTSGRLTPPRGGSGRGGGGNRFGEGGAATVGPREAVQGRSLKSYEDLDAADGNANGELDY